MGPVFGDHAREAENAVVPADLGSQRDGCVVALQVGDAPHRDPTLVDAAQPGRAVQALVPVVAQALADLGHPHDRQVRRGDRTPLLAARGFRGFLFGHPRSFQGGAVMRATDYSAGTCAMQRTSLALSLFRPNFDAGSARSPCCTRGLAGSGSRGSTSWTSVVSCVIRAKKVGRNWRETHETRTLCALSDARRFQRRPRENARRTAIKEQTKWIRRLRARSVSRADARRPRL